MNEDFAMRLFEFVNKVADEAAAFVQHAFTEEPEAYSRRSTESMLTEFGDLISDRYSEVTTTT